MKTLLSIGLCLALAQGAFAQETNSVPKDPKPDCTLCELMLVMGCVAVGGAIVIYVYAKNGNCCANHKLVLQVDRGNGDWVSIATNVVMVCTNKLDVFADVINKGDIFYKYRVQDQGKVQ